MYEYTREVFYRSGLFVPVTQIFTHTGFRSVYAYNAHDVHGKEDSKGLNAFMPHANTLPIDCDTQNVFNDVLNKVLLTNLKYKAYTSGNKGGHIELFHNWIGSFQLPYFHKITALSFNRAIDVSIYKPSSLYRLPNTTHIKSGNKKVLIQQGEGGQLELPSPFVFAIPQPATLIKEDDGNGFAFTRLAQMYGANVPIGTRFWTLWNIGKSLTEHGLSYATVKELLSNLNNSWTNPKEDYDMELLYKDLFKCGKN